MIAGWSATNAVGYHPDMLMLTGIMVRSVLARLHCGRAGAMGLETLTEGYDPLALQDPGKHLYRTGTKLADALAFAIVFSRRR